MTSVGNLEEEAKKRRQRLLALRAKKDGKAIDASAESQPDESVLPKPIFRSYKPTDNSLKDNKLSDPTLVEVADKVQDKLAAGKPEPIIDEVDLASLAPRKPDWDLKRDVSKKLEKLERRTQRAIAGLIRERIQNEKNKDGDSLARVVNNQQSEIDEEED